MSDYISDLLVRIENLTVKIDDRIILEDINFEIPNKKTITIIGPNGAGKSTLIKSILGLIKPYKGKVIANSKLRIGYVPQKIFFPEQIPLNVLKFLLLNNKFDIKIKAQLEILNSELNIEYLLNKSIHILSGGELQRVLITKALLNNPNLLILDEPTKSVDVNGQAEFYKLCSDIQEKFGCALLMASHDLHIVMSGTNFVICLNKHICCHGLAKTVSQDKRFISLFGENLSKLAFYAHKHDHHHDFLDNKDNHQSIQH